MRKLLCFLVLVVLTRQGMSQPHVVINEVMYAPISPEPEWVELLNASSDTVRMAGWTLADPTKAVKLPPTKLGPNEFLVVTKDTAAMRLRYVEIPCTLIQLSLPALNNTGDVLTVRDSTGTLVDSISFGPTVGGGHGRSLERIDALMTGTESNFTECSDSVGATPGRPNAERRRDRDVAVDSIVFDSMSDDLARLHFAIHNRGRSAVANVSYSLRERGSLFMLVQGVLVDSLGPLEHRVVSLEWTHPTLGAASLEAAITCAGDEMERNDTIRNIIHIPIPRGTLAINEVMYAPIIGGPQWIELVDISTSDVECEGAKLMVATADSTYFFTLRGMRLRPKEYAVVSCFAPVNEPPPPRVGPTDTLGTKTLHLDISSTRIRLSDHYATTIDSVTIDRSMVSIHISPAAEGISLERIHLDRPGAEHGNWASSFAPSGSTPYERNSVSGDTMQYPFAVIASPRVFSPDGDGYDDRASITVAARDDIEHLADVAIYDPRGRLVRSLGTAERFIGARTFEFDGKDEHGSLLPVGLYTINVLIDGSQKKTGIALAGRRR